MNKCFKKIVSFVVAITVLAGSFFGGTLNSYAGSVKFDDDNYKFIFYADPYGGVKYWFNSSGYMS